MSNRGGNTNAPSAEEKEGALDVTVTSWNVASLKSLVGAPRATGSALAPLLESFDASIVCFQETKLTRESLTEDLAVVDGWYAFFAFCSQRVSKMGYSGIGTYVKKGVVVCAAEPTLGCCAYGVGGGGVNSKRGGDASPSPSCRFGCHAFREAWEQYLAQNPEDVGSTDPKALMAELDQEGRCVMTDHEALVVINVYVPFACLDDSRWQFKRNYMTALRLRCEALAAEGRKVVLAGDLNACAGRLDSCDPHEEFEKRWKYKWMCALLFPRPAWTDTTTDSNNPSQEASPAASESKAPPLMVDTYRFLNPAKREAYTCWSSQTGARQTNYGTRIDYILASPELCQGPTGTLIDADILAEVMGSDHCPIRATFRGIRSIHYAPEMTLPPPPKACAASYPEFQARQQRISAFINSNRQAPPELQRLASTLSEPSAAAPPPLSSRSISSSSSSSAPASMSMLTSTEAPRKPLSSIPPSSSASVTRTSHGGAKTKGGGKGGRKGGQQGQKKGKGAQETCKQLRLEGFLTASSTEVVRASANATVGSTIVTSSHITTHSATVATCSTTVANNTVATTTSSGSSISSGMSVASTMTTVTGSLSANGGSCRTEATAPLSKEEEEEELVFLALADECSESQSSFSAAEADGDALNGGAASASVDTGAPPKAGSGGGSGDSNTHATLKRKFLEAFKPVPPPLCTGHKVPSVERVVKLKGENNGRRFYTCALPAGAPGNPKGRCDFFKWRDAPKKYRGSAATINTSTSSKNGTSGNRR